MAGWLLKKLGYGEYSVSDIDNPSNGPSVSASVTAPSYGTFTRIMQDQFNDNEEVRIAKPSSYAGSYEFIAVAPKGSSTAEPLWDCVRCTWSLGRKVRLQYLEGIAWDDREISAW